MDKDSQGAGQSTAHQQHDLHAWESRLKTLKFIPHRIVLAYAVFGALWILTTDILVSTLFGSGGQTPLAAQVAKGWIYILVTAASLYLIILFFMRRISQASSAMMTAFAARDRLAAVVDATPDLVATATIDGKLLSINKAGRDMLGIDVPEIITDFDMSSLDTSVDDGTHQESAFQIAIATGFWTGETLLADRHGGNRPVLKTILAPRDGQDSPAFVSIIIRDLSDQKRTEERLRMLQKVEALGHLTGGIAHDFNNLLVIVVGNAEVLRQRLSKDPDNWKLADLILRAGERGTDLTSRLLAFSRHQALNPEAAEINSVIKGAVPLIQQALGKQYKVDLALDESAGSVVLDAAEMETCLLNLAINARDAMPDGGSFVLETAPVDLDLQSVAQRAGGAPGPYVMVSARDTGVGMTPDIPARIFDPFFTTKDVGKGTGLGLSMVLGFVTQSGGHADVDSRPGSGTTIKLFFPRTVAVTPGQIKGNVTAAV